MPLFSGLQLHFRTQGDAEWFTFQPGGSSPRATNRAFALHLVALLPAGSRERRRELAKAAGARVAASRLGSAYYTLSKMAKDLWDGQATMTRVGQLRAGGISYRCSHSRQNEERMKAVVSLVGYDPGEGGQIPCRVRGLDEGLSWVELYCSVGRWRRLTYSTVFEAEDLKAAVEELAAAWKTAHPGNCLASILSVRRKEARVQVVPDQSH